MIEGVVIGFYAGVGLCAGLAFYLTDDPFTDEPRWIDVLLALAVAVGWLTILVGIIVPEILKDYQRQSRRGDADE